MHNFMIESLRVSGTGKIDGVVNFTDGLNIIKEDRTPEKRGYLSVFIICLALIHVRILL